MRYLLIITALWLFGCKFQHDEFEKYINQMELLDTPIVFETIKYPEGKKSKKYDRGLFERYKLQNAQSVYGMLFNDDKTVGVIYTVAGDINVPVLVTYDRNGNKIDSLNLFQNASGFDLESETYERALLFSRTIQVTDSVVKWRLDESGEDRIEGSEKSTIHSFEYLVDKDGKIINKK